MNNLRILVSSFMLLLLCGCNIDVDVTPGGRVISDPSLIDCRSNGGTCFVEDYEDLDLEVEDLIVTFRALPDENYVLDRWEGDCEETIANKCYVVLGDDVYVKAIFKPIAYAVGSGQTK
ncbi:MAG: hypothetical protein AAGB12_09160 [Pseudomonadota bacterium]